MASAKKLLLLLWIVTSYPAWAQLPVYWQKSIGGSGNDNRSEIDATADGGIILAGHSRSSDGNINITNRGGSDILVVKMDSCGVIQWQRTYGGSGDDFVYSVKATPDGGYVFAAVTTSNDGDVSGHHGGVYDSWVVKLDAAGNIQWKRTLGGTRADLGASAVPGPNGSIVFAGQTTSTDGDLQGIPHLGAGTQDGWVVYLANSGNIIWQRKIGGLFDDDINDIIIAPDGMITGTGSRLVNTQLPPPAPTQTNDAWVFKMDINGTLIWSKTYGGTKTESTEAIIANAANELVVAGTSLSADGDVTVNHGSQDAWIFKLSPAGNLVWQLSLGGSDIEAGWGITLLPDQSYLVCGESRSTDGVFTPQYGQGDAFITAIDNNGQFLWSQNYGGSLPDLLISVIPKSGGTYIASGTSGSADHDLNHNAGLADIWIAKFKNRPVTTIDTTACYLALINNSIIISDTVLMIPIKDICGHDSAYKKYTVDMIKPAVQTISDAIITTGNSVTLFTTATSSVTWDTDPTLSCLNCNNPIATPLVTTQYIVATQQGGCTAKDTVKITVHGKDEIYVPSAFSPNGDRLNDDFKATGYVPDFYMQVFNRWGNLLFSSRDMDKGWNGMYKGAVQPADIYVYMITYTDAIGKEMLLKGHIMLIK